LDAYRIHILLGLLIILICLSGFFSGSETAMMSLNRYRLRHLVRRKNRTAKRVYDLLKRPDRLLGVILLGNTFANILASAMGTAIAVYYWGDLGILISTVALTIIILLFAEITPKTLAACYPEKLAFPAAYPLKILLKILYPIIWFLNSIANSFLRLFKLDIQPRTPEALTTEELKTIVHEATGKLPSSHQAMLLRILDLQQMTVEDAMTPRNEIEGIDLSQPLEKCLEMITQTLHSYLPIYDEEIDHIKGMLSIKRALNALYKNGLTKEKLFELFDEAYFIPEGAVLGQQLRYFQQQKKRLGLVVDEYGDIQGLLSLTDILEEVVGEYATDFDDVANLVQPNRHGGFWVDASINIRDLNRITGWNLPTTEAKTLSGLIIEHLELIPHHRVGLRLGGYDIEVVKLDKQKIRTVRIKPHVA